VVGAEVVGAGAEGVLDRDEVLGLGDVLGLGGALVAGALMVAGGGVLGGGAYAGADLLGAAVVGDDDADEAGVEAGR
jgi:hypothetical protein